VEKEREPKKLCLTKSHNFYEKEKENSVMPLKRRGRKQKTC